ncbi:MAG: fatty acyl-AMP ligase [Planctomycetaceae bacterium]
MSKGRPLGPAPETSLVDIVRDRAAALPARRIFYFLHEGEAEQGALTYGRLDLRARAIAAKLQSQCPPGERVVLVYPPGLEFITALCGCFYAGVVAVPAYPPRPNSGQALANVIADCAPRLLLTAGAIAPALQTLCAELPGPVRPEYLDTDEVADDEAARWVPAGLARDTLALLQYTSGSTGVPQGVCVTHGNLLHNCAAIQQAFGHGFWTLADSWTSAPLDERDASTQGGLFRRMARRPGTGVSWLPFYHDMGLIGNIVEPLYADIPVYLLSPFEFVRRPARWLQAITRYRAHTSGGPNFAYEMCVDRITAEQKKSLDLSDWDVAYVGAEPISPATLDRFYEAFAECGFRREAFYPCYGLAESTLFVTGGVKSQAPVVRTFAPDELAFHSGPTGSAEQRVGAGEAHNAHPLVGCGRTWPEIKVAIIDPATGVERPAGQVGEIWVKSPSVAQGYWNCPEETAATFGARRADTGQGPYLRTGDLGCLVEGELFVTGRLKDVIIIRGRNYFPEDIEATVRGVHAAFQSPNRGAALGCDESGVERLIVLQEIDRRSRALDVRLLKQEIRRAVALEHELQVDEIVFVRNDSLPRTSSGKIRRRECRRLFLAEGLEHWSERPAS